MKYNKCPVPNCERNLIPGRSPHGLCVEHENWRDFLLFVLPHITVNPGRTPGGLVLPGQQDFKAVAEKVMKREKP